MSKQKEETRPYRLVQGSHFVFELRDGVQTPVEMKKGAVLQLTARQAAGLKNKVVPFDPAVGNNELAQAQAAAQQVLDSAKQAADDAVAAARKQAEEIVAQAKAEADRLTENALRQADAK